ncbi:MAG: hypothetical protein WD795_07500 [Woeseia sp.]
MQDPKEIRPARDYNSDSATDTRSTDRESGVHAGDSTDKDGWQQYRKWISTAPAPRARRGSADPSLYTWKGYRTWTEQIKRNWSDS